MLSNLKKALANKNITIRGYADFLGVSEKTIQNKIFGVTVFTYPEVKKTVCDLLPEYNADYLFQEDGTDEPKAG